MANPPNHPGAEFCGDPDAHQILFRTYHTSHAQTNLQPSIFFLLKEISDFVGPNVSRTASSRGQKQTPQLVGAGKTVYLTITMKHLQENLGKYLGTKANVTISTKRTEDNIKEHEEAIFTNNKELRTTQRRWVNAEVRLPYTYHLASWNYRKGFHPLKKILKTYLSIFDAAGEDFNDRNDTVTLTQIPNAQGLIMFIDPMCSAYSSTDQL